MKGSKITSTKANRLRRAILLTVTALITAGIVFVFITEETSGLPASQAREYIAQNHATDTSAGNAVTSIYLNYRYWDTLFEALILLVSALAVISLSWSATTAHTGAEASSKASQNLLPQQTVTASPIVHATAQILIPFIIAFGMYVIMGGADSVGGGFQGGAILASAFVVRWIISPEQEMDIRFMKAAERFFLLALLLSGMVLLGQSMHMEWIAGRVWMIGINVLIGIKVACGLTIIFYRFVFFESR